ncbi:hypothetical protein PVAND_015752 [Polypedilum vanderplanki]|uniref:RING-type domain-containing protein n=1 Tax=Polypedilum vanderplanki TaxID=319348 RepID=A0A9J6BE20_POLVA|nr:hypothetical protein PVAND_015752 [Polypedilum vanderplanki]
MSKTLESLDDFEYLENLESFNCQICLSTIQPSDGIKLKNCFHEFCKICFTNVIKTSTEIEIQCPFIENSNQRCEAFIQDRELRCFLTVDEYSKHLNKSLSQAESQIKGAFHCLTPNCIGWVEILNNLKNFTCIVCKNVNCVKCKSIHTGTVCKNLQNVNNKSQIYINQLLREQKVMKCTKCGILVQKINGCNHLKCLKCKNEFQWIGKSGFERYQ